MSGKFITVPRAFLRDLAAFSTGAASIVNGRGAAKMRRGKHEKAKQYHEHAQRLHKLAQEARDRLRAAELADADATHTDAPEAPLPARHDDPQTSPESAPKGPQP